MKREKQKNLDAQRVDTKHDVYYEENRQVIDDDFGVSRGFCFDTQATLLYTT